MLTSTVLRRLGFTLLALALGVGLTYGLTYVGVRTEGPLTTALAGVSTGVANLESRYLLAGRAQARARTLAWFEAERRSPARLRRPTGPILLGAFDDQAGGSLEPIAALEDSLRVPLPIIQCYSAWGSRADEAFPEQPVELAWRFGSLPLVTWEPWLGDFAPEDVVARLADTKTRDKHGLQAISAGAYDAYLDRWAAAARRVGHPLLVRLAHEMNDPYRYPWGPQNNAPADFVAAWRHVVSRFRQAGATNVLWVWSPHPAYSFAAYYPGPEYVDWVGVGALNYGTVAARSQWWRFADIFGQHYPQLAAYQKPIMITEFGSLAVGGNRGHWFAEALRSLLTRYPLVRSVLFYHNGRDNTTTLQQLDWTFRDEAATTDSIRQAIHGWPRRGSQVATFAGAVSGGRP